ncbi:MAG TPA: PilZ domain-containing protein [Sphingomicrobium sp.]
MGSDERRSARANVILAAFIEHGRMRIPVRISNVSEHGALVIGRGLPADETPVTFHCNGIVVQSFVAWSRPGLAGIQFDSPIELAALTQRPSPPPAAIVKAARDQDFRRPGFRGRQMTDEERSIVEEWSRPSPKRPK